MKFKPIYICREAYEMLELLAEAKFPTGDDVQIKNAIVEIAGKMFEQVIKEKYPQVLEHRRQVDKMRKELLQQMRRDRAAPLDGR